MRYIVLALLFTIGCGEEESGPAPCEVFDNTYSHSLFFAVAIKQSTYQIRL